MIFQNFMQAFMYLLEKLLNSKKEELKNVSFSSDEANTDRPLKEYIKRIISENLTTIPESYDTYSLITEDEEESVIPFSSLRQVQIENIYLPDELTDTIKNILILQKNADVYRNPDLTLELSYNNETRYVTLELKSTKNDSIPGSSAQQVNPNEWVVFVKHNSNSIDVATGQYIHAVNSVMQFPDRSPRPQVSFLELQNWNAANRIIKDKTIYYKKDLCEKAKYDLLNDWQGVLAKRWVNILFNNTSIKNSEPWFNNTIRKFCLEFLKKYEPLPDDEKKSFKSNIQNLVDTYQKKNSQK